MGRQFSRQPPLPGIFTLEVPGLGPGGIASRIPSWPLSATVYEIIEPNVIPAESNACSAAQVRNGRFTPDTFEHGARPLFGSDLEAAKAFIVAGQRKERMWSATSVLNELMELRQRAGRSTNSLLTNP